jgi:hypothetical protein
LEQLRVRCSSNCIAAMARTTALRRSKDDPAAANPATLLLTFALDFHRKESVCGGHGPSLTGSLFSPASEAAPVHHGAWRRGGGMAARGAGAAARAQKSHEFLLWHEASTEEAVIYLGADLTKLPSERDA